MRGNKRQTKIFLRAIGALLVITVLLAVACSDGKSDIGEASGQPSETVAPAGDSEGGQGQPRQYKWHETYDEVRNGVRLVLSHAGSFPGWEFFTGRAENTTDKTLTNVMVVVRTSIGATLITAPLRDLAPGEIMRVYFEYQVWDPFGTWTAYPAVDVDPAVAEAQDEITWEETGTYAQRRPPIQDFVELLDIRLDSHNFTDAEVLAACRYSANLGGSDNADETAAKAADRVRGIADIALYPIPSYLSYGITNPLPEYDDHGPVDEEAAAQWNAGYEAWLTPQIDQLMELFCAQVFARFERGVNVIGQIPHPADVAGVPPPPPLTQQDAAKLYRSLPPSDRSDPDTIGHYCGLLRKHNWDTEAVGAELKDLEGQFTYFRAPIYWWYELAGFVVETPEWERWVLQEYDLPNDRRRWGSLTEWETYWDASFDRGIQLLQMFCDEYA